jgi:hypothetical protein
MQRENFLRSNTAKSNPLNCNKHGSPVLKHWTRIAKGSMSERVNVHRSLEVTTLQAPFSIEVSALLGQMCAFCAIM